MWFARFQILISEPQSIWRKFLLLSWLYIYILDLTKNLTILWTDTLSLIKAKKFRRIGHTLTSIRL